MLLLAAHFAGRVVIPGTVGGVFAAAGSTYLYYKYQNVRSITITPAVVIHSIVCTAVTTERVVIGSTICFWEGLRAVADGVVIRSTF